jgi:hypothetical protein
MKKKRNKEELREEEEGRKRWIRGEEATMVGTKGWIRKGIKTNRGKMEG